MGYMGLRVGGFYRHTKREKDRECGIGGILNKCNAMRSNNFFNQNSHRAIAVGDGVLVPLLANVRPLIKDPLNPIYQHVDHR